MIPDGYSSLHIMWDTGDFFYKKFYASEVFDASQFFVLSSSLESLVGPVSSTRDEVIELCNEFLDMKKGLSDVTDDIAAVNTNITKIMLDLDVVKDYSEGRWKMQDSKMIFFKSDNVTEIARFDLLDDAGLPSMENVFERRKA